MFCNDKTVSCKGLSLNGNPDPHNFKTEARQRNLGSDHITCDASQCKVLDAECFSAQITASSRHVLSASAVASYTVVYTVGASFLTAASVTCPKNCLVTLQAMTTSQLPGTEL